MALAFYPHSILANEGDSRDLGHNERIKFVMVGGDHVSVKLFGQSQRETIGQRDFSDGAF